VDAIALSRSLLDETQAESDLRRAARSYVKKGRELLLEKHRAGSGGVEVVSVYSTMMDQLIRHLFSKVSDDFIRRYPSENPRCTVVAQGGYGRGELNPYSDIDLLFLYSWKNLPIRRGGNGKATLHTVGRRAPGGSRNSHHQRIDCLVRLRYESEDSAVGRSLPLRALRALPGV
jgi:glutamine synthetase adenylyltransferase